ncbi:MAG: adenine deaminase, partial [Deltaproteobacteria bacterium]|nr:adenine deaminase [Deltaproteobacteria bacterium]
MIKTPGEMKDLSQVALGQTKADLVVVNGDLVNVYSGELIENQSVAVKGKWIAYVGADAEHTVGSETRTIDASGKVIIPGLIDGHTHLLYYCTPDEFLRYGMRGGTTTIITELIELFNTCGLQGIIECLDALQGLPVKIFSTLPSTVTLSRDTFERYPGLAELKTLLEREDVLGVGEGYWQEVLRNGSHFKDLAASSMALRKTVEGHAAGCHGPRLQAYLNYGISSCHESVELEDVLEKLRLGLYVQLREGYVRRDLENMARISEMPLDFRKLELASDSVELKDLMAHGYMEVLLQKAIDFGFDPLVAIQMATINPATHFGLDNILGGIAPGKFADMLVIPDPREIRAEYVISNGRVIAGDGELQVQPHRVTLPRVPLHTLSARASDFTIPVEKEGPVKVRVIDQVTNLVTREGIVELVPQDGEIRPDPGADLL